MASEFQRPTSSELNAEIRFYKYRFLGWIAIFWFVAFTSKAVAVDEISFRSEIAPVLQQHCVACHGAKKAEGGYRLDQWEWIFKPGDSGASIIVTGNPDNSELYARLVAHDVSLRMPLDSEPLTEGITQRIHAWIQQGAKLDGDAIALGKLPLWNISPIIVHPSAPPSYVAPNPVLSVAWSPDGMQILSSGYHEILVWDWGTTALVRRIGNMGQRIYDMEFSPDGTLLAVACGTPGLLGEIRIVDWASGQITAVLGRSNDVVFDIAYAPDGKRMIAGFADGTARIFDAVSHTEIRSITSHADWVESVAYSDDGKRVATASRDKTAKVFLADSGELQSTYSEHNAAVKGIVFAADNKTCITCGNDKKIRRWEFEEAKKVAEWPTAGDCNRMRRLNEQLFVGSADKKWYMVDLNTNQLVRSVEGHTGSVFNLRPHSNGTLVTGDGAGTIHVWVAKDGADSGQIVAKP